MMQFARNTRAALSRFRRRETGNGTIEFVILFPPILMIFISSFELGLLATRHAMLELGVDVTVRELRLGSNVPYDYNELKNQICVNSKILPQCQDNIRLEMIRIDPFIPGEVERRVDLAPDCVDVANPVQPLRNFEDDVRNHMMYLRVCALFEPLFPAAALGARLPHHSGEKYALIASTAYVSEPD